MEVTGSRRICLAFSDDIDRQRSPFRAVRRWTPERLLTLEVVVHCSRAEWPQSPTIRRYRSTKSTHLSRSEPKDRVPRADLPLLNISKLLLSLSYVHHSTGQRLRVWAASNCPAARISCTDCVRPTDRRDPVTAAAPSALPQRSARAIQASHKWIVLRRCPSEPVPHR